MKQYWGAVFIVQTSDRMQYFYSQFFKTNCTQPIYIQDDKSWAFTETVQNISKLTYTANRFSLLTSAKFAVRAVSSVWVNINRIRLQHYKEFIMFFLFNSFITELWRAKLACGAPWVSKSTHPRNFGNHVTVHRPPVRPHHRVPNF